MSSIKKSYKIIGLDCASCAKSLERKIASIEGVKDISINIAYKKFNIEFFDDIVSSEVIIEKVRNSGYSLFDDEIKQDYKVKQRRGLIHTIVHRKDFYTTLVSGLLLLIGALLEFIFNKEIGAQIILIIATVIGGVFIFIKAWYSIRNLRLDINILMTIAAIAALAIQEEIEAASIVFLFSVAEIIEQISIDRSKKSIEDLIDFAPSEATVITKNGELIIPADIVPIGEIIIVKSGDRLPLDGIVESGKAYLNQASITGESMPVLKEKGDEVFAGTLCEDGTIRIRTTKDYQNIFLKKIIALVEDTDHRAPIERFVDLFARFYTPLMFLIAIFTIIIPPLVTGDPFVDWVYRGLVILVISCPCAVVLSTPITIVAAISRSAKNGVLIKGGTYIENLSKTKVFAFDKTGTLTIGHPLVKDIIHNDKISETKLLQICGSLEANSRHPIARAIWEKMHEKGIAEIEIEEFKSITGKGIQGKIDGNIWFVGNKRFYDEKEIIMNDYLATEFALMEEAQKSIIVVGSMTEIFGLISVIDQLKSHARELIQELKDLSIEKTIMLTGDSSKIAHLIAQETGVDEYYAELLPDDKLKRIAELQKQYGSIAMLGDGINDAPALAQADVGIALGAKGSDIALESADIALMTDSFDSLHYLMSISRRSMFLIKFNIIIAILVKLILFVLSYFGFIELWMAVLIGDMGVSLFVIFNAIVQVKGKKMTHLYCENDKCEAKQESIIKKH
ncbi:MAG: cation-translocating P-type ATPase [Candidatus Heimdallarchaeota archaeon]|nr:cation-translocating P-type ATPase [Candidatus Heimdallarchaeota archaeon]